MVLQVGRSRSAISALHRLQVIVWLELEDEVQCRVGGLGQHKAGSTLTMNRPPRTIQPDVFQCFACSYRDRLGGALFPVRWMVNDWAETFIQHSTRAYREAV